MTEINTFFAMRQMYTTQQVTYNVTTAAYDFESSLIYS